MQHAPLSRSTNYSRKKTLINANVAGLNPNYQQQVEMEDQNADYGTFEPTNFQQEEREITSSYASKEKFTNQASK